MPLSDPADPISLRARPLGGVSPRVVSSDALFLGAREIRIAHGGECYRLTVTRQGKLILTK
jgi:hemin uptake protein HemP